MNRMTYRVALAVLLCGTMGWSVSAFGQSDATRYKYRVRGEDLMRGRYVETLQALQAPNLLDPATTWADLVQTLNRMSEVGANAVCFDLVGLSADGAALAPEVVRAMDYSQKDDRLPIRQIVWRRMGVICRVFGEGAPEDPAYRANAIATVARELGNKGECVYWVDGPGAADLAAELKRRAPRLVVAAPANGDILAVTDWPSETPKRPVLLVGKIPQPEVKDRHFVVPGTEENYRRFETVMAFPEELRTWTPDNSVLSEEERNEGFISLFNGRNLDGWVIVGKNKEGFVARNGAIEWARSGGGQLRTVKRYDDYVLRLEWKIAPNKNNGLQLRCPRANRNSKIGFEFQMLGQKFDTPNENSTASIYDVLPPLVDASKPAGEWNTLEITLDGPHYKAVLNGVIVQDVNFDEVEELKYRLRNGFIVISDHGGYAAFRNIRLKPL